MILAVVVHAGSVHDRDGAKGTLRRLMGRFSHLSLIWADGQLVVWAAWLANWTLKIGRRSDDAKGFKVLPKCWMVERTFGWLGRYRRLCKGYEEQTTGSETWIYPAMINLMPRRLAPG
jgi:putative transposase